MNSALGTSDYLDDLEQDYNMNEIQNTQITVLKKQKLNC